MRTGKESKPPGHVHRQQLFHWIGGDLDKQNGHRKVLRDDLVDVYSLSQPGPSLCFDH